MSIHPQKLQKYKKVPLFPNSFYFFIIIFTLNFTQFQLKSHVVLIALIYNYNVASVFSATIMLIHQNVKLFNNNQTTHNIGKIYYFGIHFYVQTRKKFPKKKLMCNLECIFSFLNNSQRSMDCIWTDRLLCPNKLLSYC